MKKLLIPVFLVLLTICLGVFWFYQNSKPVSKDSTPKSFLIVLGTGAGQIGTNLEKQGLIRSALVFKVYLKFSGVSKRILAGEYSLSPGLSLFGIVRELLRGPGEIWITIPEGLRREEVAQKFATSLGKDKSFVQEFLSSSEGKEGFLFPETYLFPKDTLPKKIVEKMLLTFDTKVGLTIKREDVILASLIERETRSAEERPVVAGILENRLKIGMPLQVDATIQYVKGGWESITLADRGIQSSFNTYLNRGLPPAPICNPGLSSLKAALNPSETEYLYYLHDARGVIHYAKTLGEHNQNIQKYLE